MAAWKIACIVAVVLACWAQSSDSEARPCDPNTCKIPDCRCSGTDIPGGFPSNQTPQIVMLTFDDAISVLLYNQFYKKLLTEFKNPNGCPIGMTFFTSHEYCDYQLVNDVWSKGHEIASHSISHRAEINYWKNGNAKMWADELVGMQDILVKYAKIPREDIRGVRVPFLQTGGNTQFQVMKEKGFLWECSMPTRGQVDPGLWPYSLDYRSRQECQIGPCPTESFPGLWVVPMLDLFDKDGNPCAMLDTCIADYQNETYDLLMKNFFRSYDGNRAPYGLYVHAAWFLNNPAHWAGYIEFLQKIVTMKDVYIVTVSQALDWIRSPVPASNAKSFAPWRKQCKPVKTTCAKTATTCRLMKNEPWGQSERYMRICGTQCPSVYPWVGNPEGNKQ